MVEKIERRTMIKALGALSVGAATPAVSKAEVLVQAFETKEKNIACDILVIGGGTAGTIAGIQAGRAGSKNFIVAGRCVSSDRLANSALRVQASCMGMGQAAAASAVLACKSGKTPSEVPLNDIWQLLEEHGAIVPGTI